MTLLAHVCRHNLQAYEVELYDTALQSRGYDRLVKAIDRLLLSRKSGERFPSVAELRELVPLEQAAPDPKGEYEPMSEKTKAVLAEWKKKSVGFT